MTMTTKKYIIFLIKGKFKVSKRDNYKQGEAYIVEKEETIQLEKGVIVVIIDIA